MAKSKVSKNTMRRMKSLQHFVDECEKRADLSAASHTGDSKWTGTESFDEAIKFARYGWDGPDAENSLRLTLEPQIERMRSLVSYVPEIGYDVHGGQVDIARYLDGEPECMMDFIPQEVPHEGRVVNFIVNISVWSGVSAEAMFKRGVAILLLVDTLNKMGFDMNIWIEESLGCWSNTDTYSVVIPAHTAGDPLDIKSIAFALANPSMLRRLAFGYEEGEPQEIRNKFGFKAGGGYGAPHATIHKDFLGATVELGMAGFKGFETDATIDPCGWVIECLKEQGLLTEDQING